VPERRLTKRRLFGIDRSGPPPRQTLSDQPLNPWTIPNAIGFVRLALIPVFLIVALGTDDGVDALSAILFAVIGWADYLDGFDYMNVNLDGNTIGDTGNVNYFYFNNSKFNAGLAHAASLFGTARANAYAALDKTLMEKYVPFIPYEVSNNRFLTATRVKNYIYSSYFNYPILQALSVG